MMMSKNVCGIECFLFPNWEQYEDHYEVQRFFVSDTGELQDTSFLNDLKNPDFRDYVPAIDVVAEANRLDVICTGSKDYIMFIDLVKNVANELSRLLPVTGIDNAQEEERADYFENFVTIVYLISTEIKHSVSEWNVKVI